MADPLQLPLLKDDIETLRTRAEAIGDDRLYRVIDRLLGAEMELRFIIGMEKTRG